VQEREECQQWSAEKRAEEMHRAEEWQHEECVHAGAMVHANASMPGQCKCERADRL
jgi:hypothetical protein